MNDFTYFELCDIEYSLEMYEAYCNDNIKRYVVDDPKLYDFYKHQAKIIKKIKNKVLNYENEILRKSAQ
jgi:5-methylthioribose kinase